KGRSAWPVLMEAPRSRPRGRPRPRHLLQRLCSLGSSRDLLSVARMRIDCARRAQLASLADAESGEDSSQQVIRGEFPGDLAQGQLRSAELLRDELPGAMLGELPRGFLGVRARARERLEVPAAGADRAALDGLKAHALLQVRAQLVEPLPGE